jgi:hypothetical protein
MKAPWWPDFFAFAGLVAVLGMFFVSCDCEV